MTASSITGFALAVQAATATPAAPPQDWPALLRQDAKAIHQTYVDSHPGAFADRDPKVAALLDTGLKAANTRAETVTAYPGYYWALREYIAGFDDGHAQMGPVEGAPDLPSAWPGFIARFDGDGFTVVDRLDEPGVPVLGARIRACDGRPAVRLAAENVGRFRGQWMLPLGRRNAWRVFQDEGNPFIRRPEACEVETAGARATARLTWRDTPSADLSRRARAAVTQSFKPPTEMRTFGPGRIWISTPSFGGDPASAEAKALTAMIVAMGERRADLAAAEVIVLDLRGNGGGSSDWSVQMADRIWGEAWRKAKEAPPGKVDWRASEANLTHFDKLLTDLRAGGQASAEMIDWLRMVVDGMKAARAEGRPFFTELETRPAPPEAPAPATRAKVYVVAHEGCGSACLDAMDLWIALGATPVARETAADTVYMDIRMQLLPSGLTRISVPTKAYLDRPRGSNETYKPAFRYDGDMADTSALETWISGLPR